MIFTGLNREVDVLTIYKIRVSNFKSLQVGPHSLSHLEFWAIILSVNEAIPAVESLNFRDTSHISTVILVILKIVLHF